MISLVFWISLFFIVYTYVLYPLLLLLLKIFEKRTTVMDETFSPTVSIVIAVYNERDVIEGRLENLRRIGYQTAKIECIIGSDGSDDGTNLLLAQSNLRELKVKAFPERRGKAAVLNELIPQAEGEIVVLSDANTFYRPDTVRRLVSHFADPQVGAVFGELILESDTRTVGGMGEGYYWMYEYAMKRMESDISTTVGATGAVYAIRKKLFKPLPTDKPVMDDFIIPLNIVKEGFKVKYEPQAVAHEIPSNSVSGEFRRKVRIGAANFYGLSEFAALLHPRYGFASLALWSRKILRWCVPFLMMVMIAASLMLAVDSQLFRVIVFLEAALFASALLGFVLERIKIRTGILGVPYYFVAMNLALFVGFLKFAFGRQPATWEVIRS